MSAVGVPPPPVVSCHLGTLSFVTTDIYPLLFRHHQGFPVANHCVQQQKRLNEELHNCTPGEHYIFIQSLKVRENEYERKYSVIAVLIIPGDYGTITLLNLNDPGNLYNSITNYCTIKLEDLTKYECTYVGDTIRRA